MADDDRLEAALHPYAWRKVKELTRSGRRLAHYSSAFVVHSIISKGEVWMRSAQVMNDYSEIAYGFSCLEAAIREGLVQNLNRTLDHIVPGAANEAWKLFEGWRVSLQVNTFITCLSEHLGHENREDELGRLSMWRAYGGEHGVALILNPSFLNKADLANVHTSPVLYAGVDRFCDEMQQVIDNIEDCADVISRLPAHLVAQNIFGVLRFAVLCTKHPGFWEEREWRVIYTPQLGMSPQVKESIEVVEGLPQVVQKIQIADIKGVDKAELFEGVLIGPTQFPMTHAEVFHKAFVTAGIDPHGRIRYSQIPLRR